MKRVFIVDDEVYCIKILKSFIEKYQIPMEICGSAISGETAYVMIKELRPDIVFMDIEMPGYSGLEVIKKIQEETDCIIHFVIISAYDEFRYAQEAIRLKVDDFLLKPLDNKDFLEMTQRVFGFSFTSNQAFNEILAYVHENLSEELTLNDCAKKIHMSSNHITRIFKQYYGVGFTKYKNSARIEKAKKLFIDTDKSIKEISQEVGFCNLNYFYKLFKETVGTTPKEYQDNILHK